MLAIRALSVLLVVIPLATGLAQGGRSARTARHAGMPFVELTDLARAGGVIVTAAGDVLTFRGALGVVTFFAGSEAGLLQRPGDAGPTDVVFSEPVLRFGADWWAPLDALEYLGAEPGGDGVLLLRGGVSVALRPGAFPGATAPAGTAALGAAWEVDELGDGVTALRFYEGEVALTLLDLALLPLAQPELTAAVDAALGAAWEAGGAGNVLLLQVTALQAAEWEASLRFVQGGRDLEARHPFRLLLQAGSAGAVAPDAPVAGVVLLPAGFDLYRPLQVEWAGVSAVVTFRR